MLLANGHQEEDWPITAILITLDGQEGPTFCLVGPAGPALLGAVTLEEFAVGVDPIAKRLVPVRSYLTRSCISGILMALFVP